MSVKAPSASFVRMTRPVAASERAYQVGVVYELPDDLAIAWCEAGCAEPVTRADFEAQVDARRVQTATANTRRGGRG